MSSAGDAYHDITPYDEDDNPGLATGIRCITTAWNSSGSTSMIAGLFKFGDDIRLAVSITCGESWVLSAALDDDASNITMRIGDIQSRLVGFSAGGKVKICKNARLGSLAIIDRTFDLDAPIAALSVFG